MYFYVYEGRLYWGRYQYLSPHRSLSWVFRNKPMKIGRWYFSGGTWFYTSGKLKSGEWKLTICRFYSLDSPRRPSVSRDYSLQGKRMYYLDGFNMRCINPNDPKGKHTKSSFRNRLKEYEGRYFLPFRRHAICA